jgi:hypothetical protein
MRPGSFSSLTHTALTVLVKGLVCIKRSLDGWFCSVLSSPDLFGQLRLVFNISLALSWMHFFFCILFGFIYTWEVCLSVMIPTIKDAVCWPVFRIQFPIWCLYVVCIIYSLVKVLSQHSPGGAEENHTKTSIRIAGRRGRESNPGPPE